jgi:SHS family lactate transporter-like MFS transporter
MTITQVIANIGCALGAMFGGYTSEIFGRRLSVIFCCVMAGALCYPYTYVSTPAVAASAFFLQFFIQGAFGIMPSHLMEMAPPVIRTFVVGSTYQLGNLASSPAAQLQAKIGEKYFPLPGGKADYAVVICAFLAASIVLVIVVAFLGTESKGRVFGVVESEEEMEEPKHIEASGTHSDHMEEV